MCLDHILTQTHVQRGAPSSGYFVTMAGGPVNWSSKLQDMQAMPSGEAEYIASADAGQEIIFGDNFFTELGLPSARPHILCLDSTSTIQWSNNPSGHSLTKHIDLEHDHFTRSLVSMKHVSIEYIPSAECLRTYSQSHLVQLFMQKLLICLEWFTT